ncbi:MAG: peptidylprolyl isomerase [Planctomycetota bacterium]|nr:peptidylprolyl isomerase [Planctomycetota bacterium]MDE1890494.1 peptidylprolyl isomerase [Planctomycetota bacterium]MDE2215606.1 peptidylprolyl isomerase [Planctomycetota bacterium]
MIKRITIFMFFSSLFAVSFLGCQKGEHDNPQLSSQTTEQDFAKIHKNINFNQEEKEKMHGAGMATEGSEHGMGTHGKKEKVDPNKVIATVNNEKILRKDLDKILSRFRSHVNPATISSMEQQITEQLVTQSLLRQFVLEKKLSVPNEVVEKEIAKMRDNIKNNPATKDKTLEQFLEFQGSNIEELKTAINMSAAIENYVSKDVDDKKTEEYFIKNISTFNGETVTASHILVETKKMKTQEELDKAKAKIDAIKKELDEGADFAELAKKYSDCPTGKTGGELGSFPKHGVMVDAFANAAFATEVGKICEPVKTEFGYHLIKVTARTPAKDVSFGEVKDKVHTNLVGIEMNNLVKDLREKAKIEITL